MDHNDIDALAREIAAYLSKHPEAADTADGILRWWLPRVRLDETAEDLQRALDLLAARGVVQRRQLSDGRRVYGRVRSDAPVQDAAHDDTASDSADRQRKP